MNSTPAFNGPGIQNSQPMFNTNNNIQGVPHNNFTQPINSNIQGDPFNNAIQSVPIYNMQMTQQFTPNQIISQPMPSNGGLYLSQPNYVVTHHATPDHSSPNNNQYLYRMSSTSDEEELLGFDKDVAVTTTENPWQVVKTKTLKRRKIKKSDEPQAASTSNKFNVLNEQMEDTSEPNKDENASKAPKPPPIFVYGVINYAEMINKLRTLVDDKQYITKCLADNTIKINSDTPDTYRKLIKFMRDNNVVHHTYQPKEERAYRIVLKNLHHTTDVKDIKEELLRSGHKVRNIINGRNRITKEPINLFFVDLEPSDNNKEIYKLTNLNNRAIKIEPPKRIKGITQCMRCQQYGHSKTYCSRPYVCVKCGGPHNTTACKKTSDTPAKCALCNGAHPANYKGCEFYHKLLKPNNANNRLNIHHNANETPIGTTMAVPITHTQHPGQQSISYANITKTNTEQMTDINSIMSKFLEEFKNMFHQLIQQNSMVLNMLTTLVSKIQ